MCLIVNSYQLAVKKNYFPNSFSKKKWTWIFHTVWENSENHFFLFEKYFRIICPSLYVTDFEGISFTTVTNMFLAKQFNRYSQIQKLLHSVIRKSVRKVFREVTTFSISLVCILILFYNPLNYISF